MDSLANSDITESEVESTKPLADLAKAGLRPFASQWESFQREFGAWFAARAVVDEVVYRLPMAVHEHLRTLADVHDDDLDAEKAFDEVCAANHAVAVWREKPIKYRWLSPGLPSLDSKLIESMTEFGWSDADVAATRAALATADDVVLRVQGAAGWLISRPEFNQEMQALRSAWQQLPPESQDLPLERSSSAELRLADADIQEFPEAAVRFQGQVNEFCDRWRLLGFATWSLPVPDGPKWPDPRPQPDNVSGQLLMDTPFHFPVLASDGLGNVVRQLHTAETRERGIDDQLSWQAYGRYLEIDHWEAVLRSRYRSKQRRKFVEPMLSLIAELLELDFERVKKLRTQLSALKAGRLTSLRGAR